MKISLKFVPQDPINKIPVLVQIMAWRRPGDKPLSGPMIVRLPTHICVTRPQWVNNGKSVYLQSWTPFITGRTSSRSGYLYDDHSYFLIISYISIGHAPLRTWQKLTLITNYTENENTGNGWRCVDHACTTRIKLCSLSRSFLMDLIATWSQKMYWRYVLTAHDSVLEWSCVSLLLLCTL